ncbi:MAG: hypothetical protein OEW87_13250 [Flavobacteriaceae bacterium]|nr:hypothetical protein [Flavobacteriaceae bacterium]
MGAHTALAFGLSGAHLVFLACDGDMVWMGLLRLDGLALANKTGAR